MKTKPIIFSGPMVNALLEHRKTQTRRPIKPKTPEQFSLMVNMNAGVDVHHNIAELLRTSPINVGDIMWVRETFAPTGENGEFLNKDTGKPFCYKADTQDRDVSYTMDLMGWVWKPSIHMPKEACRIFLKVTHKRIERLQDISESNAVDEGIENFLEDKTIAGNAYRNYLATKKELEKDHWAHVADDAYDSFRSLWISIYGHELWEENPWVWAYTFELTERPNDFGA